MNINGFVGRGSEAVDLNAIPAGMIDHIEILRDGAAAQYGSDAIAGVINIVLKSTAPGDVTAQVGEYTTKEPATLDYRHDGKLFYANADHGWMFGQNGYVFLGGEIRDRGYTNRAAPDTRVQYFQNMQPNDPNLPVPGGIDFKIGDSYQHDDLGWLNAGTTFANGMQLYAFGGLSHRFGDAFGFWRRPRDPNNLIAVYPNGYLPEEQPVIWDGSGYVGAKGQAAGWDYDLSTGYGRNAFDMNVVNSVNVSIGPSSPRNFYAGQLVFNQWTTNLDVDRNFQFALAPLHTAWGLEFRQDQYKVGAGEKASYEDDNTFVLDSLGRQTTTHAAAGSQVYPGYQPQDAGSHSRNNVAGYVDLSSDITSHLLLDVAGRYEHYSDFGSTTTGKIAGRYELVHGVAFRGAVSSGFRAPTLGQEYFSNTAINFVGTPAVALEIRTLPVSSPIAQVLHAQPLRPEKSMNYSAGVALEPLRNLSFTVDYYRIDLKDRIVLSNNFTAPAVVDTLGDLEAEGLGPFGVVRPHIDVHECRRLADEWTRRHRELWLVDHPHGASSPNGCLQWQLDEGHASRLDVDSSRAGELALQQSGSGAPRKGQPAQQSRTVGESRRRPLRHRSSQSALRPGHVVRHDGGRRSDLGPEVGHRPRAQLRSGDASDDHVRRG